MESRRALETKTSLAYLTLFAFLNLFFNPARVPKNKVIVWLLHITMKPAAHNSYNILLDGSDGPSGAFVAMWTPWAPCCVTSTKLQDSTGIYSLYIRHMAISCLVNGHNKAVQVSCFMLWKTVLQVQAIGELKTYIVSSITAAQLQLSEVNYSLCISRFLILILVF